MNNNDDYFYNKENYNYCGMPSGKKIVILKIPNQ